MKRSLIVWTGLMSIFLVPGIHSAASGSVVVDRVVAIVNDDIITMSDLQRESLKITETKKWDDRMVLEEMIDRKLQMAAAKRSGVDVTEKELTEAIADIMKRNSMDARQFETALIKDGLTLEQYRVELKEQITLSRVFNKYVRTGLMVDENEIRAYYDQNTKEFSLPEEIRVRQVFLKLPEKASPAQVNAAREKAQTALERARKGEDFIRLVHEFSPVDIASLDGDLGFMQRGHALPEIEQAARGMKPGELAGPLKTELGFHLIRLEEVRTPIKPFEKVKDEISNTLFQQKMENTYRTWLQTLRSDAHIESRL